MICEFKVKRLMFPDIRDHKLQQQAQTGPLCLTRVTGNWQMTGYKNFMSIICELFFSFLSCKWH